MANTGRDDAASTLGAQLSSLPPGPDLAALIASIDVTCVDDECDLADVVAACARLTAWSNAKELAAIAEFARRPWPPIADPDVARSKRGKPGEVVREFVADEIAATLAISPGAARFRVNLATTLAGSCRATAAALAAGLFDVPKARAIADGCRDLDPTTAAEVEAKVLANAPSQTTATVKRAVRKAVISADPAAAQQRAAAARSERGVWLTPLDDGKAALYAVLAAEDALTVHNVRLVRQPKPRKRSVARRAPPISCAPTTCSHRSTPRCSRASLPASPRSSSPSTVAEAARSS